MFNLFKDSCLCVCYRFGSRMRGGRRGGRRRGSCLYLLVLGEDEVGVEGCA